MFTSLIRIGSILAWATVYFLPKRSVKRYIPVTILASLITVTVSFIGHNYDFWEVSGGSKKRMWNLLSIVLGYFSLGCLWIFHLTFGKFWLYLLINLINNFAYAFGIIPILEKLNFIKYVKFTRIHHIIVTMTYSLILYGYQMFFDKPDSTYLRLFSKRALK
jgi:hypothetical protein